MKITDEGRYSKELKKASRVIVKIAEILTIKIYTFRNWQDHYESAESV